MPRVDTKTFYKASLQKYAQTPKGVQWNSLASQQIRFEALVHLLPDDLSPYTLVDAGCGFGDFYTFLQTRNKLPKKYIGIDCLDFMCSIASRNTQQTIIHEDILHPKQLPVADFYICSGALNTLSKFESYLFIQNCYQHAREGVVFNTLYGTKKSQTYNYLHTQDIENLQQTLQVDTVQIYEGYIDNDITLGFFKKN